MRCKAPLAADTASNTMIPDIKLAIAGLNQRTFRLRNGCI